MNTETTIKPQPKLILPFLAWNFGWTWGFWLLDIILKNLWPDSPPTAYLALSYSKWYCYVWAYAG